MQRKQQQLLERLPGGPAFLLLGQSSDKLGGDQTLLQRAAAQAGTGPVEDYHTLASLPRGERVRLHRALAEISAADDVPEWLEEVARYPWNGVLTTRVDSQAARAFDTEWRRVVAGTTAGPGRHPRSSSELRVWSLFGGVALPDEQQPPLDVLEAATTRRAALDLLQRLPDALVTPRGTLLIEGYDEQDWLRPEDLYALLDRFLPGQTHLFSAAPPLLADPFVAAAVERGLLTAHSDSLSLVLSEAEQTGRLRRPAPTRTAGVRALWLGGTTVPLGRDIWNRTVTTARPIDDNLLAPPPAAGPQVRYQRFRDFLGATDGAPPWSGIAEGFNFRRDFEQQLLRRAAADLAAAVVPSPLVVQGQAATGKSTALCALALDVAREGTSAVLHVAKRGDRPSFAAIDDFALWAEEHGAHSTLLIWDGMGDADDYFAAHRFFRSLGRRVLVVGSTYRGEPTPRSVLAPAELSADEQDRLQAWLAANGVDGDRPLQAADSSFLAALYRLLPETRTRVERGLTFELRTAELGMQRQAQQQGEPAGRPAGAMAAALQRAGLLPAPMTDSARADAELRDVGFEDRSTAEQLTTLVLVAGKRGLQVPLELVLRVLGRDGSASLVEVIKKQDIVRWTEDEVGDQFIGARTRLEAEILSRHDLADPLAETHVVTALLAELRVGHSPGGGPEVQFAVDLLSRMGPQSDEMSRYAEHYPLLISALSELRLHSGATHPRLALQEANFAREYVHWAQSRPEIAAEDRVGLLRDAQAVLEDILAEPGVTGRGRLNLLVELASTLGSQVFELSAATGAADTAAVTELTDKVVRATLEARQIDPGNYYPVDVVAWVTARAIRQQAVTPEQHASLLAAALASLDSVDQDDLSPKQQARYDGRYAEIAELLDDPRLAAEHLQRLAENDDPAAYYLLAMRQARLGGGTWDPDGADRALAALIAAPQTVHEDWRCARLLLDLFWLVRTGTRFMRGERQAVAFDQEQWQEALDIVDLAAGAGGFDAYRAEFLRGLALFHLGRPGAALTVFQDLDRSTVSITSRVVATHVASTPDGVPRKYTGQARSVTPDGRRGRAWIDQLGQELPFTPYRFSNEPLDRGDLLPEFHIAFNLRGPYLDPVRAARLRSPAP